LCTVCFLLLLPYAACFHCRHDAVACLQQAESKFANLVRNSWKLISSVGALRFRHGADRCCFTWRRGILGQGSRCGWIIWSGRGSCNEENFLFITASSLVLCFQRSWTTRQGRKETGVGPLFTVGGVTLCRSRAELSALQAAFHIRKHLPRSTD